MMVSVIAVGGCAAKGTGSPAVDTASATSSIAALDANCERWIASASTDSLISGFYSNDASFMIDNAPAAVGPEGIRKAFNALFGGGPVRVKLTKQTLKIADSLASEQGTYTLTILPKAPADTTKPVTSDHGSYVTTYINRNGQWRALYDVAVSAVPLPMQMPAPAHASTNGKAK
jgi:ketosteroid isomerase-like protein